jgi:opine dehydrogenase
MATKFAVIGAGHGGKAMAAHLALMDFTVTLYKPHNESYRSHQKTRRHRIGRGRECTARIWQTGTGHRPDRRSHQRHGSHHGCAAVVRTRRSGGQHGAASGGWADHSATPGRTCGALEVSKTIRDKGCTADVTIAEAETFIYAARSDGPAAARIFRMKEALPLAALPATRTQIVLDAIKDAYPQFFDGVDVIHTSLNNMGAIFHPALTLLNAGWIEATHGDYQFYIDGVTPSVARMLEVLDRERVTVASALGIRARTAVEWLKLAYDTTGVDLHEAIHNQPGYYGIKAPPTLNHRYLFEDIPMSLVPIASTWQTLRSRCRRDGKHHQDRQHHPPHRLLEARTHRGKTRHRTMERQ